MKKIIAGLAFFLALFFVNHANAYFQIPYLNLTIVNNTIGGNGSFDFSFSAYKPGPFIYYPQYTVYDNRDFQIQTQNSYGSYTTEIWIVYGSYILLQENPLPGWENTGVVCTSSNSNATTSPIENGVKIISTPYNSMTCTFTNVKQSAKTPVLIVPGILGTEISNGSEKLWLDLGRNFFDVGDSFMDPLQFNNALSPNDINLQIGEVITKKIITVGNQEIPLYDYTDGLIQDLTSQGYSEGATATSTIFTFPYDWRYGVGGVFADGKTNVDLLKQKIADIRAETGADKVDVVAHSTGGLLLKKYLMDYPADNHIGKAVFVGVPNLGAPKAIKVLLQGDNFGIGFLADAEMKKIAANLPVSYELAPSAEYVRRFGDFIKTITVQNGQIFSQDLGFGELFNFLATEHNLNGIAFTNAGALHSANFDNFDPRSAGADFYSIVGCKSGTLGGITEYRNKFADGSTLTNGYTVNETTGDGTVPLASADSLPINYDHIFYAPNADHSKMLSADGTRQKIVGILSGSALDTGGKVIGNADLVADPSKCQLHGQWWEIFSPVDIAITDQNGNRAGIASDGSIENTIPGADYEIIGGHKFVFVPTDGGQTYATNLTGAGTGTFTLKNQTIADNEVVQTQVWSNVPVTPSFTGSLSTGETATLTAQSVPNETPIVIAPSATIDAEQSQDFTSPISTSTISATGIFPLFNSDVEITLSVFDPIVGGDASKTSGVLKTQYSLDGAAYQDYNSGAPIIVSADGLHILKFFSTDKAGNNEQEQTILFSIDKTAPIIAVASPTAKDYLRSDKFTIDAISTDGGSGVFSLTLALDNASAKNGDTVDLFYQKLGVHLFSATSTDVAGNIAGSLTPFRIIATPESTISDIERAYALGWIKDKKTAQLLGKEINAMIKLEKRIDKIESRDKNGKKITKLAERIDEKIDKALAKLWSAELKIYKKQKFIADQAHNLLQEDIQWMMEND